MSERNNDQNGTRITISTKQPSVFKRAPMRDSTGALVVLFRDLLHKLNQEDRVYGLAEQFVKEEEILAQSKRGRVCEERSRIAKKKPSKSAMVEKMTADKMTIKVFSELLFKVLKVKSFTINVEADFGENSKNRKASGKIKLNPITLSSEDFEDDEEE